MSYRSWGQIAGIALMFGALPVLAQAPPVPQGFKSIFNGKDLNGWHLSRTVHHGTTGNVFVDHGEIVLKQRPYGQGGLLLTDKRYKNFELYLEVKLLWGMNSGLFLRSTEGGSAYQIELFQGPSNAGLIGEGMAVSKGAQAADIMNIWKSDDWNTMHVRMTGDAPHMTLWVNDREVWDVEEPVNDKVADETDGRIGLQLHWMVTYTKESGNNGMGDAWKPDAELRFRNIAIKELP